MLRFIKKLFFISLIFFFTPIWALQSDWSSDTESQLRLISPTTHNDNLKNIYVGLEYQLQDGWKTYWHTPGPMGLKPQFNFDRSLNLFFYRDRIR